MNRTVICIANWLLIAGGLMSLFVGQVQADNTPRLSGSYAIIRKTEQAGLTQVRLQLHLVNRSTRDLTVRHLRLWDLAHPSDGGRLAQPLILHASASIDTTLDFTLPRAELDLWRRGSRPRIVLELTAPAGRPSTAIIRLDRTSSAKGN